MTIDHYINRKTLQSGDTKPPASVLSKVLVHETDTGRLFVSDGADIDQIQGPDLTETFANKEIDFSTSSLDTALEDNPFSGLRKGGIVPAATIPDSFYGILEGATLHHPEKITIFDDDGIVLEFKDDVDNEKLGFSSNIPIARRADGYHIKGEFINSMNNFMLIGFSTSQYFSLYTNVFFNNDQGVAVGYTPSTANYSVFVNDGSGTPAVPDPFTIPKDRELHTIEIILSPSNIVVKLDNETKTLVTKLPPVNSNLYLNVYGVY